MAYLRRRNRVGDLSNKQRNPFLKVISLIVLGASVSLFLVNADLIINPQISNSIAYIKQFFVTSDGTSSGTVGVILDNSGVFSQSYCNLSGSLCKTTEDLFAVDAQLSGLVPRDDGQYTLFASGGKLFTGGLRTTVNGYSLATKLAIGYASPTNALDVSGSAYIAGSAEIVGTLTVPMLSGIASINGVNIGEFATWDILVTNGFLTGGQVDTKLMTASNILMAYITGTYLPLTGCATDQIPKFSGSLAKWVCSPDQVGVTSLTNYYTRGESDTNLAIATGALTTNLATATGALTTYLTNNYYTKGVSDTNLATATGALTTNLATATGLLTASLNNYVALSQTGNWNTVYNWYAGNPLSSYVALSQTGNWNTVYNWYAGNPLSSYVALSQTGNWNTVYNWYAGNPLSSYYTTGQINAKNYISGTQVTLYETDPDFNSWHSTSSEISDWNTAYAWGDHASQGYLTSETDPQVGTLTPGKRCTTNGTLITCSSNSPVTGEVDPVFVASPAYGITTQNKNDWASAFTDRHTHLNGSTLALVSGQALTNWNSAYNWGDHASQGYLKTESDPQVGTITTSGKRCTSDGTQINCSQSAPDTSEPDFNGWFDNLNYGPSAWDTAYLNNHIHSNIATIDTIDATKVSHWDTAYTFANNASTNNRLSIDTTNDRIGIGTNAPGQKLTIKDGAISVEDTPDSKNFVMGYDNANDNFYIDEFGQGKRFFIHSGGNVGIGTGSPGYKLTVQGTGLFTNSVFAEAFLYNSDRRLKTNIVEIADPLTKIAQLHGYTFDWKDTGRHDIGVIAQEVESVFPEAVVTKDNGFKTVNYPSLVAPIIQAVKALYTKYLDQQDQIDLLKAQVAELKTIVNQIK